MVDIDPSVRNLGTNPANDQKLDAALLTRLSGVGRAVAVSAAATVINLAVARTLIGAGRAERSLTPGRVDILS